MRDFHDYFLLREIDELLGLEESVLQRARDIGGSDVTVLIQTFAQQLAELLPAGLRSLPGRGLEAIRRAATNRRLRGQSGIVVDGDASEEDVANAIRYSGLRRMEPETVRYFLGLFRRNLQQFVRPGTAVDPSVYYSQFRNFVENPRSGVNQRAMLARTPDNPRAELAGVAAEIKQASGGDPAITRAVDQALAKVLNDAEIRSIAWHGRGTRAGREFADRTLAPYGKTHQDLAAELGGDPEFGRRYQRIQRQKRQFRNTRYAPPEVDASGAP